MKVDPALYTQNGLKTDKEAWRDYSANLGSFDVDLKHNLVTDTVNMNFLPHDLIINGVDPDDEFIQAGGAGLKDFLQPEFQTIPKVWVVETLSPEITGSLEDQEEIL